MTIQIAIGAIASAWEGNIDVLAVDSAKKDAFCVDSAKADVMLTDKEV